MSPNPPGEAPKPPKGGNSGTSRGHDGDTSARDHLREASTAAFRKVEASAPPSVSARLRALRERIRQHRSLDTVWRVMVFATGCTLMAAGLLMFVLPGPGWATLILGLVVLASEFTWANRVLDPVKVAARRASDAAMDPQRRRRNLTLAAIAGVLIGIVVIWYLLAFGVTIQPIMDLLGSAIDWVRGLFQ